MAQRQASGAMGHDAAGVLRADPLRAGGQDRHRGGSLRPANIVEGKAGDGFQAAGKD